MRILWVSPTSSRDHTGGGGAYSRSLLALLRGLPGSELDVIEPDRGRSRTAHRVRQARSLVAAARSRQSAKLLFDRDADVRGRLIQRLEDSKPELVVFNGTSAAAEADVLSDGLAWVVVVHNVEGDLYAQQLRRSPLPMRVLGERVLGQSRRHLAFEARVLAASSASIFVSEDDARRARELVKGELTSLVVPPSFPAAARRAPSGKAVAEETGGGGQGGEGRLRLGFLAKMSWWPNREALRWFLREVWPEVDRTRVELHVFGEGSEAISRADHAVHGHGFVPDLSDVWRQTDVFINPMRGGGGVNVKVCEALFQGFPVLSSPEGLRGLPDFDDPALGVCGGRADWLAALSPTALAAFARRSPRRATSEHFSAERAALRLDALLRELAPKARAQSSPTPPGT